MQVAITPSMLVAAACMCLAFSAVMGRAWYVRRQLALLLATAEIAYDRLVSDVTWGWPPQQAIAAYDLAAGRYERERKTYPTCWLAAGMPHLPSAEAILDEWGVFDDVG